MFISPPGAYEPLEKKGKTMAGPVQYLKEVKAEARKVSWPTRKETIASTIAVFIMVTLASIFLFLADQILAWGVSVILGLGV
jgi:preprotein translocase subunit SecE